MIGNIIFMTFLLFEKKYMLIKKREVNLLVKDIEDEEKI